MNGAASSSADSSATGTTPLEAALATLQERFLDLDWTYHDAPVGSSGEKMYKWPGPENEDILVCVHKSNGAQELFHRHDFFYFNYTYKGEYDSLSYKFDNRITVREGELYAGQPFAGHALCVHDNHETVIVGILIKRATFFQSFLPLLPSDSELFRFLLDPVTNRFSDEFIHMDLGDGCAVRLLIEMIVCEYADAQPDTQAMLKPLVLSFLTQVARLWRQMRPAAPAHNKPADLMYQYMGENFSTVTLGEIAKQFNYHPNYVSALLRRETGKTFSELLLDLRMERASLLLEGTDLSVARISDMLGYSSPSNFYKAYRAYFGHSPRNIS